jgi:hypothetical protein
MLGTVEQTIRETAGRYGVPPDIALQVARRESGLHHYGADGNVLRGKAGEYGLFQLMPGTAADCGINPLMLEDNVDCGVRYLAQQYRTFGSWDLALSAYNAGPGNVSKGIIPESTKRYVASILEPLRELFTPEPTPGQYEVATMAGGGGFRLPDFTSSLELTGNDWLIPALGLGLAAAVAIAWR